MCFALLVRCYVRSDRTKTLRPVFRNIRSQKRPGRFRGVPRWFHDFPGSPPRNSDGRSNLNSPRESAAARGRIGAFSRIDRGKRFTDGHEQSKEIDIARHHTTDIFSGTQSRTPLCARSVLDRRCPAPWVSFPLWVERIGISMKSPLRYGRVQSRFSAIFSGKTVYRVPKPLCSR